MAFVQSASQSVFLVTSTTLSFTSNNGASNCILVDLAIYAAPPGITFSISDSQGNTYALVGSSSQAAGSGTSWAACWVAPNIRAGANTITVTLSAAATVGLAIHEYAQVLAVTPVDTSSFHWETVANLNSTSITTGYSLETIHFFGSSSFAFGVKGQIVLNAPLNVQARAASSTFVSIYSFDYQSSTTAPSVQPVSVNAFATSVLVVVALKMVGNPLAPGPAWMMINEPVIGLSDQSNRLHVPQGGRHSFTRTLRQRGTAQIPMIVLAGDSYAPTMGTQVYLYDPNAGGNTLVFAGTIDQIDLSWFGNDGIRVYELTVVSFEQCFDTLLVPPQTFYYETAADIFTALFNSVAGGVPLTLGTVNATFLIYQQVCNWDRLSEIFSALATAASCTWGIDLSTLTVFLQPPTADPAPYVITSDQVLWESNKWNQNRSDYRNRQIVRISLDAFQDSGEVFPFFGVPQTFTLLRPAQTVTESWWTTSTQSSQTGGFSGGGPSGNPSSGDTVSIGYPSSGSIYNWAPHAPYYEGQIVIDTNGNTQKCTAGATVGKSPPDKLSGSSTPAWSGTIGGNTTDGAIVWTNLGPSGVGGLGASVYTFVDVLDNTQWGQVLIDLTAELTLLNLQSAILADQNPAIVGQKYSWPTWENPVVNCSGADGTSAILFTVKNKKPGSGYIAALLSVGSAFTWSGSATTGGVTGNSIQLSSSNSGNTSNLYFTPGSTVCSLASRPSGVPASGGNILVIYQRAAGDCIIVENTAQVNQRAAIENGTGKYQQITDDSSLTSNTMGLQVAQAALAAYAVIPIAFSFMDLRPGLQPGQLLTLAMTPGAPEGLAALINGEYLVQEIQAELIPCEPYLDSAQAPNAGHYRYTVTVINESQIFSFLAFWEGLASGGGGSNGPSVVSTGAPGSNGTSGAIHTMGVSGNLIPVTGGSVTNQAILAGSATLKPPAIATPQDFITVQLIQDATGGRTVAFDAFYLGLSQFVLDLQPSTQAVLVFQVNGAGTAAQCLGVPQNGQTIV